MNNIDKLRKKIIYRSIHRGIKEMDLLLSSFVNKYVNDFKITELKQLDYLLNIDDDDIFNWYINKQTERLIPKNKVTNLLKKFKIK